MCVDACTQNSSRGFKIMRENQTLALALKELGFHRASEIEHLGAGLWGCLGSRFWRGDVRGNAAQHS